MLSGRVYVATVASGAVDARERAACLVTGHGEKNPDLISVAECVGSPVVESADMEAWLRNA
jgi:threonine synthase